MLPVNKRMSGIYCCLSYTSGYLAPACNYRSLLLEHQQYLPFARHLRDAYSDFVLSCLIFEVLSPSYYATKSAHSCGLKKVTKCSRTTTPQRYHLCARPRRTRSRMSKTLPAGLKEKPLPCSEAVLCRDNDACAFPVCACTLRFSSPLLLMCNRKRKASIVHIANASLVGTGGYCSVLETPRYAF